MAGRWRRRIRGGAVGIPWAIALVLMSAGSFVGLVEPVMPVARGQDDSAEGEVDYRGDDIRAVVDFTGLDRPEERDSYYGLLNHARTVPLSAQLRRAREVASEARRRFATVPDNVRRNFGQFADVVLQPDLYRGRPITLSGHLQRLDEMDAGENDFGLVKTWQAYLFTDESRPLPWVIVATEVAAELPRPRKGRPTDHVVVTGYFHKLWRYETAEGHWAAPLILTGRIEYRPPPAAPSMSIRQTLWVVLVVAGMMALATAAVHAAFGRRSRRTPDVRPTSPTPESYGPPEGPLAGESPDS